jgi:hypothetical protein
MYAAVKAKVPDAVYDEAWPGLIMVERQPLPKDA